MTDTFAFSYNRFMRVMMPPMLAGPRRSSIVVDDTELTVRMGAGGWMFAATVQRSSIASVTTTNRRVAGWGVHGFGGRWLVNGSGQGLVTIAVEPQGRGRVLGIPVKLRQLTVSAEDPAGLVAALSGDQTRRAG